MNMINNMQSQ